VKCHNFNNNNNQILFIKESELLLNFNGFYFSEQTLHVRFLFQCSTQKMWQGKYRTSFFRHRQFLFLHKRQ